jgi:hypothetical protein
MLSFLERRGGLVFVGWALGEKALVDRFEDLLIPRNSSPVLVDRFLRQVLPLRLLSGQQAERYRPAFKRFQLLFQLCDSGFKLLLVVLKIG